MPEIKPRFILGGDVGAPHLVRNNDTSPLDTHYQTTSLHGGLFWSLSEDLPEELKWLEGSGFITELHYGHTSGDDQNRGSHKDFIAPAVGLRATLFQHLPLTVRAGFGPSFDALNFGTGVPLQSTVSGLFHVEAKLGGQLCLEGMGCAEMGVGFAFEQSLFGGTVPHQASGFFVGVTLLSDVFTSHDEVEDDEIEEVVVESLPPIIHDQQNDNEESQRVATGPVEALFLVSHPIYFPNNNPNIPLDAQSFDSIDQGALQKCYSNALLDAYIRNLLRWLSILERRQTNAGEEGLKLVLSVKAYSNETGLTGLRRRLAKGRSQSVIDYLTKEGEQSQIEAVYQGKKKEMWGQVYNSRYTCGAFDHQGRKLGVLDPQHPLLEIRNGNAGAEPADPTNDIRRDFGRSVDAQLDKFRRAVIRLELTRHGQPLSLEETAHILGEVPGDDL